MLANTWFLSAILFHSTRLLPPSPPRATPTSQFRFHPSRRLVSIEEERARDRGGEKWRRIAKGCSQGWDKVLPSPRLRQTQKEANLVPPSRTGGDRPSRVESAGEAARRGQRGGGDPGRTVAAPPSPTTATAADLTVLPSLQRGGGGLPLPSLLHSPFLALSAALGSRRRPAASAAAGRRADDAGGPCPARSDRQPAPFPVLGAAPGRRRRGRKVGGGDPELPRGRRGLGRGKSWGGTNGKWGSRYPGQGARRSRSRGDCKKD